LNPWPIAYLYYEGKKIKVFEVEYKNENLSNNSGEIVIADKSGLWIQTALGIVNLKRIQLEGKKEMDIQSFMNGLGKQMFHTGQIL
jgi:methionyl-tRNA formyltransferase